jgi:hypothetical protein
MINRIFLYPYAGPGGRNYLKEIGTLQDIALNDIRLEEGVRLSFYCEDADDAGKPDDLLFEGTVHFDSEKQQWYVIVEESSYRHASDLHDSTGYYK